MTGRVVNESYTGGADVTPSDDDLIRPTRAIMVAVTGDVAVQFVDGSTATIVGAIVGKDYRVSVVKVLETGTDATGIIALY